MAVSCAEISAIQDGDDAPAASVDATGDDADANISAPLDDSNAEFAEHGDPAAESTAAPEDSAPAIEGGSQAHSEHDPDHFAEEASESMLADTSAMDAAGEGAEDDEGTPARAARHQNAIIIQTAVRGRLARRRMHRISQGVEDPFAGGARGAGAASAAGAGAGNESRFDEVQAPPAAPPYPAVPRPPTPPPHPAPPRLSISLIRAHSPAARVRDAGPPLLPSAVAAHLRRARRRFGCSLIIIQNSEWKRVGGRGGGGGPNSGRRAGRRDKGLRAGPGRGDGAC